MKFANTEKAYVFVGVRESVGPYGVTRDFTDEEVSKSPEIRYARERGYLVPFDPKKHNLPPVKVADSRAPKKGWVTAPDDEGGVRTSIKTKSGKTVEYIVADTEGVDGVSSPDQTDVISAIDGQKPVDFIEEGMDAHGVDAPQWKTASDRFEDALKEETTQDLDYNDDETLSEGEAERPAILDADEEIERDFQTTIITPPQGNMGAAETTVRKAVAEGLAKGSAALAEAVRQNFDDGEGCADDTSPAVKDFLAQNFSTKKWAMSKETNKDFVAEVSLVTKSENVKSLADQRLTELG